MLSMKRGKLGVFFTLVGVVIFIAYLVYTNPFKVLTEVGRFDPVVFGLAVSVNYLGLFSLAVSWYILLRVLGVSITPWRSIQMTFASLFAVWVFPFPSGVEIIRAYLVKDEEGSNHGKAISSVIVSKVYYNISFGAMIAIAAILMYFNGENLPVQSSYVIFVVLFTLVNTLLFGVLLTPNLLRLLYDKSPKWVKKNVFNRIYGEEFLDGFYMLIDEIESSIKQLSMKPLANLLSLFMVAFHWCTGAITAFMVASSLGYQIDFWVIVLIYAVIEFIQQLNVFIPSGLGIVDSGLTGAFILVGVPMGTASAISLLTRLATYWLELVLCGLISFQFGYREALRELIP